MGWRVSRVMMVMVVLLWLRVAVDLGLLLLLWRSRDLARDLARDRAHSVTPHVTIHDV